MIRDHLTGTALDIVEECDFIAEFLIEKNRKYGNSVLEPVRIFSRADPIEQINVRADDKLSRIKSGQEDEDEDSELDLLGYLVFKRIATRRQRAASTKPDSGQSGASAPIMERPALVGPVRPATLNPVEDLGRLCGRPHPVRVATT
jgi:hypothetical protein